MESYPEKSRFQNRWQKAAAIPPAILRPAMAGLIGGLVIDGSSYENALAQVTQAAVNPAELAIAIRKLNAIYRLGVTL